LTGPARLVPSTVPYNPLSRLPNRRGHRPETPREAIEQDSECSCLGAGEGAQSPRPASRVLQRRSPGGPHPHHHPRQKEGASRTCLRSPQRELIRDGRRGPVLQVLPHDLLPGELGPAQIRKPALRCARIRRYDGRYPFTGARSAPACRSVSAGQSGGTSALAEQGAMSLDG
jgi:hypothetical protein